MSSEHSSGEEAARDLLRGEGCDCDFEITVLASLGKQLRYVHRHTSECALAHRLRLGAGDSAIGEVTIS